MSLMKVKKSTSINNNQKHLDLRCCYGYGCSNNSAEIIEVNAGTFGKITLFLCSVCIRKFKPQEV